MKLMSAIIMSTSIMTIFLSHPMSMGLALLIKTTMIALIVSTVSTTSWYSYILFLVMIGGMMVLFIYMTSIASNEKFKLNMLIIPIMLTTLSITMIMMKNYDLSMTLNKIEQTQELQSNVTIMFNKFWSTLNSPLSVLLFIYLLITMIATVKITKMNSGPLRQIS